jgi:hypothetical protein
VGNLAITTIRDQNFAEPYRAPEGPSIYIIQPPFHLTEAEYFALCGGAGRLAVWAHGFVAGSLTVLVHEAAKWIHALATGRQFQMDPVDKIVIWIAIGGAIVLEVINALLPTNRSRLMKRIKKHFNRNRPSLGAAQTP